MSLKTYNQASFMLCYALNSALYNSLQNLPYSCVPFANLRLNHKEVLN